MNDFLNFQQELTNYIEGYIDNNFKNEYFRFNV
jgi:hypothetical protein